MSVGIRLAASVVAFGLLLHAVKRAAIAKAVIVFLIISVVLFFVFKILLLTASLVQDVFKQFYPFDVCVLRSTNSYFLKTKKCGKAY